jgi:hypothetical protein
VWLLETEMLERKDRISVLATDPDVILAQYNLPDFFYGNPAGLSLPPPFSPLTHWPRMMSAFWVQKFVTFGMAQIKHSLIDFMLRIADLLFTK